MKNTSIAVIAVFLVISIGNVFRITEHSSIRAVDFVSILAVGMLAGVLLVQVINAIKNKKTK